MACMLAGSPVMAVPGAWEAFTTEAHAQAWALFDFADNGLYAAAWQDEEDPFVLTGTVEDNAVWLFADEAGGQDALLGDYRLVEAIRVDLYVDDPDGIDIVDLALSVQVNGETRYVYSPVKDENDFPLQGWEPIRFSLSEPWFFLNADDEFEPIVLTSEILETVAEAGIRIFPKQGVIDQFYAVDNFQLEALLIEPVMTSGMAGARFRIQMQPDPGIEYELQTWSASWGAVGGVDPINGTEPFSYRAPAGDGGIFRFAMSPFFTEIEAP